MKRVTGHYRTISSVGEKAQAFIPLPLPPSPSILWSDTLRGKFQRAMHGLGQLDTLSTVLPDADMVIYTYVRKEAVLSSQIEGTQSSLSDLMKHEQRQKPNVPLDDVREVSNYVAALQHGITRLRDGFPLSLRLIREMHKILLQTGRGSRQTPGEFRRSQNWVGGTRPGNAAFVPPPPEELMSCLDMWEKFLHNTPVVTDPLLKAALAHVQFETIHPFLDGNGRIGRLLITLLLQQEDILHEPVLYLSLYFKEHRTDYYNLLNRVRTEGDWESWLDFFADGVYHTAREAIDTANRLTQLANSDAARIAEHLGQKSGSALRVHSVLRKYVFATVKTLARESGLTTPTVRSVLEELQDLRIVSETTGRKRSKLYIYNMYFVIMMKEK